jgi:hypothetical protein
MLTMRLIKRIIANQVHAKDGKVLHTRLII